MQYITKASKSVAHPTIGLVMIQPKKEGNPTGQNQVSPTDNLKEIEDVD